MTKETIQNRYDRQKLIEGWDQKKLEKGRVTIIGSDVLARYVALPLVSLGVGNITILDSEHGNKGDMLLDISLEDGPRAQTLEHALKKINPEVDVHGINTCLDSPAAHYFLEGSDVIIDATNSKVSKSNAAYFAAQSHKPLFSAATNSKRGKIIFFDPKNYASDVNILLPIFDGQKQDDLISMILGGVIAEEVKKMLMKSGEPMERDYDFNAESDKRFSYKPDLEVLVDPKHFAGKKILQVGAGALGCFLGPLAVNNMNLERYDVIDFDNVEPHNLNRQVCFYNSVGKLKAEALARVLKEMSNGKTQINAIVGKFTEEFQPNAKYDLIFDAVDSFFTKAILHTYAKNHNIPIISGGTDYRAATVLTYQPGKTSCFDCQINLSRLALKTEIIRRTSCLQSPDPSVIMTNQIAGGLMVAEARRVLRSDVYGEPANGEIKYISDFETKGGYTEKDHVCSCHEKPSDYLKLPDAKDVNVKEVEINGKLVKEVYVLGEKL